MADVYNTLELYDSGFYYAHRAFEMAQIVSSKLHLLRASELLSDLYNQKTLT